jgi:uncharacterized protein YkwD
MRRRLSTSLAILLTAVAAGCEPAGSGAAGLRLALSPELDDEELEFLRLINAYREENGAEPLAPVDEINAAADAHSEDMGERGYFAHEALEPAPWGVLPWDRMCAFGYGPACAMSTVMGENIAAGYPDALSAFEAWRHSPGHDANMRDGRFRAIGVGRVLVESSLYRWYWTTDFAGETPDCACADGQHRACETESCGPGLETCSGCSFEHCEVPGAEGGRELCADGFDNDCDGETDEEVDCGPPCEPGPEVCDGADNDCDGAVDEEAICDVRCFPLDEVCDGVDNDCDLTVDEGCPCDRRPDDPFCGVEEGLCTTGTQECDWGTGEGVLTECRGARAPAFEICDGFDNDCDGMTDEGDACGPDDGSDGDGEACSCRAAGAGGNGRLFAFISALGHNLMGQ